MADLNEKKVNDELNEIVVDDGYLRIPVKNTYGEQIGVFCFNPTDIGILKRFEEVRNKFESVVEPLQETNINPDGTGTNTTDVQQIEEAEKRLYDLCDYLFGGEFSKAFFGKVNPFSPIDGKFYCENALNMVANFISKKFDTEVSKISTRVDKYTHGIRTGRHKDGTK